MSQKVETHGEVGWSYFSTNNDIFSEIDNDKNWDDDGLLFGWGAFDPAQPGGDATIVGTGSPPTPGVYLRAFNRRGNTAYLGDCWHIIRAAAAIPADGMVGGSQAINPWLGSQIGAVFNVVSQWSDFAYNSAIPRFVEVPDND